MNNKGQSLIEAVVALGAAVLVISAIAVAVITSLNNSDYSKYQSQATLYAQQGLETVKSISENDWNGFSNLTSIYYCLADSTLTLKGSSCPNITGTIFTREVDIYQTSYCNGAGAQTTVTVSWNDGRCPNNSSCHKVSLNSCFNNINNVSGP